MIPLVVIEGPTASGKSALALELAQLLNAEIVSADSRQIYRHMNIGTAKPSQQELKRVTHHMIDIVDPKESFSAGMFSSSVSSIVSNIHQREKRVILCGGTGLYVRAVLDGLCPMPVIPPEIKQHLQNRLEIEGLEALYSELQQVDYVLAARVSCNDKQRIIRGLEVFYGTGRCLTEHWGAQPQSGSYKPLRVLISPPREALYHRIDHRITIMLQNGLLEEISMLLAHGYSWQDPGLNSLGYKEYREYFTGLKSLAECSAMAAQYSRNYAKRQMTWYRNCRFDLVFSEEELNISSSIDQIKTASARFGDY